MKKIIFGILIFLLISCQSHYDIALKHYNANELNFALMELSYVTENSKNYQQALDLIEKIKKKKNIDQNSTAKLEYNYSVKKLYKELAEYEQELDSIDVSTYPNNFEALNLVLKKFEYVQNRLNEAKCKRIDSLDKLSSIVDKKLNKCKIKSYPILRKKFADYLADELWKYDMYIKVNGPKNTTIEFRSIEYSTNYNIDKTQNDFSNTFKLLRFKKVIYKATKYDTEYTYYKIDSPNDND